MISRAFDGSGNHVNCASGACSSCTVIRQLILFSSCAPGLGLHRWACTGYHSFRDKTLADRIDGLGTPSWEQWGDFFVIFISFACRLRRPSGTPSNVLRRRPSGLCLGRFISFGSLPDKIDRNLHQDLGCWVIKIGYIVYSRVCQFIFLFFYFVPVPCWKSKLCFRTQYLPCRLRIARLRLLCM